MLISYSGLVVRLVNKNCAKNETDTNNIDWYIIYTPYFTRVEKCVLLSQKICFVETKKISVIEGVELIIFAIANGIAVKWVRSENIEKSKAHPVNEIA